MWMEKRCLRCGSAEMEPGAVQSTGRISFRVDNARFFTFQTGDVPIKANICLHCGAVELVGDVYKAQSLVGRARAV
jgi:predicted nucleic-acid-binding Zn-ribbon protein